ncbi:universal stress protein [Haloarcula nitratireducens]|uniref:Universal stress protein n=1 Tax=Haloarcula nitratireducens TaxID=2487749 RepID=A0AAW4PGM3_9EURY|nr:universal stress protein [Halomicroarcula nitratireducens]MBX0296382.1 universal stress protein [Halomicroarcula nitratireducens]
MERALIVVEPTEIAKGLVREAGTLAEGVDAEVTLLHVTTEEAYSARRGAMESIPDASTKYTPGEAEKGATEFAEDVGREVLSELDVEYEAAGAVGDEADEILRAAEEYGCDHVFLPGRQRSPTGKALFGDATQRVALDFNGPVTVVTE